MDIPPATAAFTSATGPMTSLCGANSSHRSRPSMRFLFVGPPASSSLRVKRIAPGIQHNLIKNNKSLDINSQPVYLYGANGKETNVRAKHKTSA
jgi:hypothetical protein